MWRKRLKQYLPRSLLGRAALILFVPIVALQLIVSIHFIQNNLEDVTRQMSDNTGRALREVEFVAGRAPDRISAVKALAPISGALGMEPSFLDDSEVQAEDLLSWWDFSAHIVREALQRDVPGLISLDFTRPKAVVAVLSTRHGPLQIEFSRRLVAVVAPHQLIVTTLFFGLIVAAIGYIYLRNQMRPIKRMAEAAEAFGRGQSVPYSPSGATEVRAAGGAFLAMRARIERHIEQRTLILSGVSHDLRTPLTRLKLGLALLDEEDAAPLRADVEEMERLIDEFLEFSRGTAESAPEEVDVRAFVARIVEDARRSGLPVTLVPTGDDEVMAMIRPVAIRRSIDNLLNNAVRYGTKAELSVVLSDRSIAFRVADDGPGIPADRRAEAMRPFARLDPARNQNKGSGVGLGLAIAADIARVHGGRLQLGDSERLGGLRAEVVIPR
ncbi:ATP-binding protein [Chachezhania sediminis]|uniref:ATP-binding protein n=1 Tax=Chachezhania sediminis TaxID=2599291 RepID=UPI00131A9DEF|nr:ATP-binding protein [Chachezhania sediminis]